jgi:DNA-binding GntR family transcriptional regulator
MAMRLDDHKPSENVELLMKKKPSEPENRKSSASRGVTRGPVPVEEEIYQLITQGIIAKRILPGARLKEASLASEFGVSRMRVRRVLGRLVELNVLEFRLNIGAVVCRPSPDESRSVFRTRKLLESEAIEVVTRFGERSVFAQLRESIREEKIAFDTKAKGVAALSSRFHLLLGEASKNRVLAGILHQLVHRCVLIQSLYERYNEESVCLVHEHGEIVDMMEQGNAAAAIGAMAEHLDHIEATLDYSVRAEFDKRLEAAIG